MKIFHYHIFKAPLTKHLMFLFFMFVGLISIFFFLHPDTVTYNDGPKLTDLFDNNLIQRTFIPGTENGGSIKNVEPGFYDITGGWVEIGLRGNQRVIQNIFPDMSNPLQASYPQSYQPYASNLGKIIYELTEIKGLNKLGTNRIENEDVWACINAARFDLGYAKPVDQTTGHVGLSRTLANALGNLE